MNSKRLVKIYRYWALRGKSKTRAGLSLSEAVELSRLERAFNHQTSTIDCHHEQRRGYIRCSNGFANVVDFADLAYDGVVCQGGPVLREDTVVEVHLEDQVSKASYRFLARVAWQCEGDGADLVTGLHFEGAALAINYGPMTSSPKECPFSRIASAA